jgi:hypothetical protein
MHTLTTSQYGILAILAAALLLALAVIASHHWTCRIHYPNGRPTAVQTKDGVLTVVPVEPTDSAGPSSPESDVRRVGGTFAA